MHMAWAAISTAAGALAVAALVGVAIYFRPDAEDRFDDCLALAERAGLSEDRRDDVILLCLANATAPRGSASDATPSVTISPSGNLVLP